MPLVSPHAERALVVSAGLAPFSEHAFDGIAKQPGAVPAEGVIDEFKTPDKIKDSGAWNGATRCSAKVRAASKRTGFINQAA